MVRSSLLGAFSLLLLVSAPPVVAHHSFVAEFDQNRAVTLTGVVTKVEFQNPHIYFYLDVQDQDGKTVNWAFEGGPPNILHRQGWKKDSVKPGDVLTVKGFRAKDGSYLASFRTVTLPDGSQVFGGTPGDGGPGARAGAGDGDGPKK